MAHRHDIVGGTRPSHHPTLAIFDYNGFGSLENPTMLRFIKNRSKTSFITYDLDIESDVRKALERNELTHKEDFLGLGQDKPGKRAIEGLLPAELLKEVNGEHADLVQQALYGNKEEQKSAKNTLKQHYLAKFKSKCQPTPEWFGGVL